MQIKDTRCTAAKHVNVSAMSNLADEREIKHDATFP